MKKVRVTTCQVIHQEWEYEIEVPDDFENNLYPSKYIFNKIRKDVVEGHCTGNEEVVDEMLVEWNDIEA